MRPFAALPRRSRYGRRAPIPEIQAVATNLSGLSTKRTPSRRRPQAPPWRTTRIAALEFSLTAALEFRASAVLTCARLPLRTGRRRRAQAPWLVIRLGASRLTGDPDRALGPDCDIGALLGCLRVALCPRYAHAGGQPQVPRPVRCAGGRVDRRGVAAEGQAEGLASGGVDESRARLSPFVERVGGERRALGEIVVRAVVAAAPGDQRVRPGIERDAHEAVCLLAPAPAVDDLAGERVRPTPLRKVELDLPVFAEHRRHEERGAEHILAIERLARGTVGK